LGLLFGAAFSFSGIPFTRMGGAMCVDPQQSSRDAYQLPNGATGPTGKLIPVTPFSFIPQNACSR
jgi:hypothetical protein